MFPVAGGLQKLAGGDTGDEPYKGKHGQERWQKMRENVIKEWETEQAKRSGSEQRAQAQESASNDEVKEVGPKGNHQASHDDSSTTIETKGKETKIEEQRIITKAEGSTIHKLKEKLFKRL